jgi:hypothetical protein
MTLCKHLLKNKHTATLGMKPMTMSPQQVNVCLPPRLANLGSSLLPLDLLPLASALLLEGGRIVILFLRRANQTQVCCQQASGEMNKFITSAWHRSAA